MAYSNLSKDPETGKTYELLSTDDIPAKDNKPLTISLLAALSYGFASLAMVFINKAVLMEYPYSMSLLTLQQLATAVLLHFGGMFGACEVQKYSLKTAIKLIPLALFYNANVAFALASLKGINIPMYIALKRLTPLAVLITDYFNGKPKPQLQVALAVILTAVGVVIASIGDFAFDFISYIMALTSVFFQTAYLVLVEKSGAQDGMKSTELMFYNAVLSLPFLLILVCVTGEVKFAVPLLLEKSESIGFFITMLMSLLMGIVLNFTMFFCTIVNSALTTTIVGVLKGVGSTVFGFILLGGVEVHALNVAGLSINTLGGVWYSFAKYSQKRSRSSRK